MSAEQHRWLRGHRVGRAPNTEFVIGENAGNAGDAGDADNAGDTDNTGNADKTENAGHDVGDSTDNATTSDVDNAAADNAGSVGDDGACERGKGIFCDTICTACIVM